MVEPHGNRNVRCRLHVRIGLLAALLEGDALDLPVPSLRSAIHPIKRMVDHGLVPGAVPCLDIGLDLLEEVRVRPLLRGEALGTERSHLSVTSGLVELNLAIQPSMTARTSGKRFTSPMKRASKGEVLSRLHARVSRRGTFKSTTGNMATVSGHRHRALPRTHPTPKPVETRLKIVASFSPS